MEIIIPDQELNADKALLREVRSKSCDIFQQVEPKFNVLILGVGAIGSNAARSLGYCSELFTKVTLVDGDTFNIHNIGNQDVTLENAMAGINKAKAVYSELKKNKLVTNFAIIEEFVTKDNIDSLPIDKNTIVLLCIDNADATRLVLNYLKTKEFFVIISGAIPIHISEIMLVQGVVRVIGDEEEIDEFLEMYGDETQESIDNRISGQLKSCRAQSFFPVVSSVANITAKLACGLALVTSRAEKISKEREKEILPNYTFMHKCLKVEGLSGIVEASDYYI